MGIIIAVTQLTPALHLKRKGNFQKNTRKRSRTWQKDARWPSGVSKEAPRHRRNQKRQCSNVWRQILQKRGKQKQLFEMNITLERKEILFSLERKSALESLAQNIPEWPSPLHARNFSITHMTDTSVLLPLRWSFWWRIYPSYGTQRAKSSLNSYECLNVWGQFIDLGRKAFINARVDLTVETGNLWPRRWYCDDAPQAWGSKRCGYGGASLFFEREK